MESRRIHQVLLGRFAIPTLAVCCLFHAGHSVQAQPPVYADPGGGYTAWMPPPQPVVPGPGWLSDDPNRLPYCDGTTLGDNGWPVPAPFKYAPQGHRPSASPDLESCLLTPEDPDSCFFTTPPTYFGTFYFDVIALDRRSNLES